MRGEARHEGERFSLKDSELHQLPGALGDPFRVIGMLPGVSTPLPLLPYYVIRGASPGTNGFFLDGMRVPQLFHFLIGGGVVHGDLIDHVDFYPGAYDVSFGRYAGGVIDSETRPARNDGQHLDLQLRLYDIAALAEFRIPVKPCKGEEGKPPPASCDSVRIAVAGHYGYPTYIIRAIDPRIDLQYGDYQLRVDWRGLTLEAMGSYDAVDIALSAFGASGLTQNFPDNFMLEYHRIQLRDRARVGRLELEAAVVGGYDEMVSFGGNGVRKLSLGWRFNLRARWKRFASTPAPTARSPASPARTSPTRPSRARPISWASWAAIATEWWPAPSCRARSTSSAIG